MNHLNASFGRERFHRHVHRVADVGRSNGDRAVTGFCIVYEFFQAVDRHIGPLRFVAPVQLRPELAQAFAEDETMAGGG